MRRATRWGLALLDAVSDVVGQAGQPLPDAVLGYADVRQRVVLAQPQPQPSRRVLGVLPQLPFRLRERPGAGVPGVAQGGGEGLAGALRGVVGRLPGERAHHLVEFAVAAVVFEGAGAWGQPSDYR